MESEGKKENKKSKKEISELEIIERDLITKFRKDIKGDRRVKFIMKKAVKFSCLCLFD